MSLTVENRLCISSLEYVSSPRSASRLLQCRLNTEIMRRSSTSCHSRVLCRNNASGPSNGLCRGETSVVARYTNPIWEVICCSSRLSRLSLTATTRPLAPSCTGASATGTIMPLTKNDWLSSRSAQLYRPDRNVRTFYFIYDSSSIFAATIKSFSERPPIAWVMSSTVMLE